MSLDTAAQTSEVVGFLDDLLDAKNFNDFGPNGLQVPGRESVKRIVTAVSAHAELLEAAIAGEADMVVTHHGLIWDFQSRRLSRRAARRLRLVLDADLNMVMYHLPLDAHPKVGNNALLADALQADGHDPFGSVRGLQVGRLARFNDPISRDELVARTAACTQREPLVFPFGPNEIRRVALLSGGGANQISQAIAAGADAYITGEPTEHVRAEAREGEITFLAAGHHATERFGVQAVGELLKQQFPVEAEFIDVDNPV